jgi:hypothetical protein
MNPVRRKRDRAFIKGMLLMDLIYFEIHKSITAVYEKGGSG